MTFSAGYAENLERDISIEISKVCLKGRDGHEHTEISHEIARDDLLLVRLLAGSLSKLLDLFG